MKCKKRFPMHRYKSYKIKPVKLSHCSFTFAHIHSRLAIVITDQSGTTTFHRTRIVFVIFGTTRGWGESRLELFFCVQKNSFTLDFSWCKLTNLNVCLVCPKSWNKNFSFIVKQWIYKEVMDGCISLAMCSALIKLYFLIPVYQEGLSKWNWYIILSGKFNHNNPYWGVKTILSAKNSIGANVKSVVVCKIQLFTF